MRQEQENQKINENFDSYVEMDAAAESKKIAEHEMAKNKRKAEIHLIEPRSRLSENKGYANKGPCGGTERGYLHYMTQAGSRNYLQWKTLKSHKSANCTVSISEGGQFEQDFRVLHPKDNSAGFDGSFPCGRSAGFEGKEFKFPSSLTCVGCVL